MAKHLELKITGMHCASCEKIIAMELSDLPGASNIKINSSTGAGELDLDSEKSQKQDIINAIKKAGYGAEIINQKELTISDRPVDGQLFSQQISDDKIVKIKLEISLETQNNAVAGPKSVPALKGDMAVNTSASQPVQSASQNKRISLSLSGMHCASCATIIERSLKKVSGVKDANVNFAAEKASVLYDESRGNLNDLIAAVKNAGYKGTVAN